MAKLICYTILVVLMLFAAASLTQVRPQYTTFRPKAVWMFKNHDSWPYTTIRKMCWDDGWCEAITNPYQIEIMVDWLGFEVGEVYLAEEGCFLWTYKPYWGDDGHPHINRHEWIECP